MKSAFLMIAVASALTLSSCKDDDDGFQVKTDNPKQTEIDKEVHNQLMGYFMNKRPSRVMVAITKNGSTHFYSYAEKSSSLPNETNVYEIGSVTKTFTGLLVAREVKAGTIDLNAPAENYFDPADHLVLEHNGKKVTVLQLLTHSSGLSENPPSIVQGIANGTLDPENPIKNYTHSKLITDIKNATFDSDPGKQYAYSNFGFAILGEILRVVTGNTFEENIATLDTQLGLQDTRVTLTSDEQSRFVKGHSEGSGKEVEPWEMGEAASVGALHSTAQDMIKYLNAYINATPSSLPLDDAHKPLFTIDNTQQVGYAWNRVGASAPYAVWHNGETNGQRCFVGFFEDVKAGVIILCDKAEGDNSDALDVVGLTLLVKAKDLN
jgi:CubicO group peptidase (beta-lactamase class C family)